MSHQLFTNSAILLIRRGAHPYIPIPRPQCARSRRIGSREKGFSHASQISSHQNRALRRHRNRPRLPGRRLHVGFHPVQQVPGNVLAHFYAAHPILHEGEPRPQVPAQHVAFLYMRARLGSLSPSAPSQPCRPQARLSSTSSSTFSSAQPSCSYTRVCSIARH